MAVAGILENGSEGIGGGRVRLGSEMETITGEPERDLGSVGDKCGIIPFVVKRKRDRAHR